MINRRNLLGTAGAGVALVGGGLALPRLFEGEVEAQPLALGRALPEGVRENASLDTLPGKKPLIRLAYRPPNYESPIEYLRTPVTPNNEFFVRYHLSDIPQVDAKTWKLSIGGDGANGQAALDLDELKRLPAVEVTAVCQCSGNRRGLFQPHVPGVEWGYGAMGCARWKGARLKDVLDKVGLKKEAVEIVFNGADGPALEKTPDFVKSLPVWKAIEETTLVAYEMNGEPLPHWNGFPARIVVPGWTGTYWMKHVVSINAVTKPFDGFWMKSAYRIPVGKFPIVARFISQETPVNTPITECVVNSLITSHADGAAVKAGARVSVGGIAWDGGYGIRIVEVSTDGGKTWAEAALGRDAGRYALRTWTYHFTPPRGRTKVTARATNAIGQSQTAALILNPAGYHHNVMQTVTLVAA
ncbi:MAG TPA: molybdopterin-dependent oxidoreductase [Xanthobacteraceae bacterium]|jgi:DMSO/TMAO reductase YedYZ molybdopterin-dependent catalytic subunit|nr:molybdopterin-dependent oxidoreductase [Xanthobacteraceae bacterium]